MTDVAEWVAEEVGRSLLTGTAGSGFGGLAAAVLYNKKGGKLSCPGLFQDGQTWHGITPYGCSKVVDMPVLGSVSSVGGAIALWAIPLGFVIFVVALIVFVMRRHTGES